MGLEQEVQLRAQNEISLVRLILCSMVAGGVQFGWALQLSLLTPYVQTLGLPHALASIVWLCGPVAGFVVGPMVGLWSDRCRSRFGRRRPFILTGCIVICISVLVIGFSSDIGVALGDTQENCSTYVGPRWIAAIIYVAGFWALDFANNTVQGPARAMMADLSGKHGCSTANIIYAFWMAFGNILGFSSGSGVVWHKWVPSLKTISCCEACANLKGAFLVAVDRQTTQRIGRGRRTGNLYQMFLLICLVVSLIAAKEVILSDLDYEELESSGLFLVLKAFKRLPAGMPSVLSVTALTWLAWFPFLLYNTDWMGREIFHGDPSGTKQEIESYDKGVRQGAFGLLLNSIVLGISSLFLEHLCRKITPRLLWVMGNFTLFLAMLAITVLSLISKNRYNSMGTEDEGVKIFALGIEAFLGFPNSILFSIPFAYAAQLASNEGGTQHGLFGLAIGVLNISIVVPQVFVTLSAGPWDALFGDGNVPAFALASIIAFIAAFFGFTKLPTLSRKTSKVHSYGSMH